MLIDKLENTEFELSADAVYTFGSDATTTNDRFSIVFKSKGEVTNSNDIDKENVLVYNNEHNRITVICSTKINMGSSIAVYNTVGQKLAMQKRLSTTTVMNRTFTPGIYLVAIDNGAGSIIKKVVVK